jgi:hypothetical protein
MIGRGQHATNDLAIIRLILDKHNPTRRDNSRVDHSEYLKVVTYCYKALFKRRSGYTDSQGNHRTKDLPLKSNDLRQLLPFLAKYKVGARLILAGVRRNGQRLVFTRRKRSTTSGAALTTKAA